MYPTAESVLVESDEYGWELVIETDAGDTIRVNVHRVADDLLDEVAKIRRWLDEGRAAAAAYVPPPTDEDLDGYDLGDPKRIALERRRNT